MRAVGSGTCSDNRKLKWVRAGRRTACSLQLMPLLIQPLIYELRTEQISLVNFVLVNEKFLSFNRE